MTVALGLVVLGLALWAQRRRHRRSIETLMAALYESDQRNEKLHERLRHRPLFDSRSYPSRWRRQAIAEPAPASVPDRHVVVSDPTYDEEETTRCR